MSLPSDPASPDFRAARKAAMARYEMLRGIDDTDPTRPCGHTQGIRTSTRLTSDYRSTWRQQSMDVKPAEVMECLRNANVKNWCLMGLHGYVGYLPMPRATQDVHVMVPFNQKKKAIRSIEARWPQLEKREAGPVVRFHDPGERDRDGNILPVIDLMPPWSPFQETILKEHVILDESSGDRYPTAEAAIVSKYAALISPHRSETKVEYDAGDLRNLILAVSGKVDASKLESLASQVWENGGEDIQRFIQCAREGKPFPL